MELFDWLVEAVPSRLIQSTVLWEELGPFQSSPAHRVRHIQTEELDKMKIISLTMNPKMFMYFGRMHLMRPLSTESGKEACRSGKRKSRNIMLFASEVPVIAALNRYREIDDVFRTVWERTNPDQVEALRLDMYEELSHMETEEERVERLIVETGAEEFTKAAVAKTEVAETSSQVQKVTSELKKQIEALPAPLESKEAIKKHVISDIHKSYGSRQEAPAITHYQQTTKTTVTENNLEFFKRKIGSIHGRQIFVGGRIDGKAHGKVVEVKNRMRRFMDPLPQYDIAQLQTYLHILDSPEGELVEHLRGSSLKTRSTLIQRDLEFWENQLLPHLTSFSHALTAFMEDQGQQRLFLQSDQIGCKDIIRDLWLAAPRTM